MATGITLAVLLALMLGAFFGLARVDRRTLPAALTTAAILVTVSALVAASFR
jgi:hypothetical protein